MPANDRSNYYYVPELNAVVDHFDSLSVDEQTTFADERKKFIVGRYLVSERSYILSLTTENI